MNAETVAAALRAHPDLLAPYTRDDGTAGHWVDAPLDEVIAAIFDRPSAHVACPQLGRLRCTRTDTHDPNAVGGHTYEATGSPDAHDVSEQAAEDLR